MAAQASSFTKRKAKSEGAPLNPSKLKEQKKRLKVEAIENKNNKFNDLAKKVIIYCPNSLGFFRHEGRNMTYATIYI